MGPEAFLRFFYNAFTAFRLLLHAFAAYNAIVNSNKQQKEASKRNEVF